MENPNPKLRPNLSALDSIPVEPNFRLLVHLQEFGDRELWNAAGNFAGTRGQSHRLEGFELAIVPPIAGLGVEYMAHLEGIGDTPWHSGGTFVGTRGESRRLEGFAIRLTGTLAAHYDVSYLGHLEGIGDTGVVQNGGFCGTRGESRRCEGMQILIHLRGA